MATPKPGNPTKKRGWEGGGDETPKAVKGTGGERKKVDTIIPMLWPFIKVGSTIGLDKKVEFSACRNIRDREKCNSWLPCQWKENECLLRPHSSNGDVHCNAETEYRYGQTNCDLKSIIGDSSDCKELYTLIEFLIKNVNGQNGKLEMSICRDERVDKIKHAIIFSIVAFTKDQMLSISIPDDAETIGNKLIDFCQNRNGIKQIYYVIETLQKIKGDLKTLEVWIENTWLGRFDRTKNSQLWVRQIY